MKKIISILSIIISILLVTNIEIVNAEMVSSEIYESNSEASIETVEKIYNYFQVDDEGQIIYPDFIGGMYIDDNGNLVVQYVDDESISSDNVNIFNNVNNITKDISTVNVEYSYSELLEINEIISDYYLYGDYETLGLMENYVDVFTNSVVVKLRSVNENTIDLFKNSVVDSEAITFIENTEQMQVNANLYPGNVLDSTMAVCTIGYRAKVNGKEGYITAGHCFANYSVGTAINNGSLVKKQTSGSVDAAFIQTFSTYTPSNTLSKTVGTITSLAVSNSTPIYIAGQQVGKIGQISGVSTGKVTSLSWSGTMLADSTTYTFSGMVLTSLTSVQGDSGGPVMKYSISTTSGELLGIISGSTSSQAVFSPVEKINSAFSATRY